VENVYMICSKFIRETTYKISWKSPEFYRRYHKKIFRSHFSGHSVLLQPDITIAK